MTALFAALYAYFRPAAPARSAVGIVFVPVYCAFNLFVYASQITVVPQVAGLQALPGAGGAAAFFMGQMVQAWPGSAMGIVNGLAYAVLGIPSIILGLLLWGGNGLMRVAGVLLILNAIACLAGPLGRIAGIPVLELGTMMGRCLLLMSLAPLSVAVLRMDGEWTP